MQTEEILKKKKSNQLATTNRLDLLSKISIQNILKGSETTELVENKMNQMTATVYHSFAQI